MQTIKAFLHSSPRALCSIHPDQTVWEALQALAVNNIGALVVLEGTKMVGIFSERDYARRVELKGLLTQKTRVGDVMTAEFITINPDQKMDECMQIMTNKRIRHLPVMKDGQLLGMVSIGDVLLVMISEQTQLIEQLQSYISG
jgi:CBS domain-containing protein